MFQRRQERQVGAVRGKTKNDIEITRDQGAYHGRIDSQAITGLTRIYGSFYARTTAADMAGS
ncbi:hypothetical protein WN48_00493 [Eufriesea mexicana]|nr:hypothetical protein WN48_00493 [Eufriesea mexicana]